MPWKDKEKQREAIRKHYYANRQYYLDKAIKRKKELRKWLNNLKEKSPCKDCGTFYPYYVMDFDHIDKKRIEISKIINRNTSSTLLKEEISGCEIVCSNCHRKRTHKRTQGELI